MLVQVIILIVMYVYISNLGTCTGNLRVSLIYQYYDFISSEPYDVLVRVAIGGL